MTSLIYFFGKMWPTQLFFLWNNDDGDDYDDDSLNKKNNWQGMFE